MQATSLLPAMPIMSNNVRMSDSNLFGVFIERPSRIVFGKSVVFVKSNIFAIILSF